MHFRDLFSHRRRNSDLETSPYTEDLVHLIASRFGIQTGEPGAYIGAASTRLAQLFLDHGHELTATAATPAGREKLESLKGRWPGFEVVDGVPTMTNLPSNSFDFILSERVLHLPNLARIRQEFRRILRPGGVVVLITDNRVYGGSSQAEAFESLLRAHCANFKEKVAPSNISQLVTEFYAEDAAGVYEDAFIGRQALTLETFIEQTRCMPIFPRQDDPTHDAIHEALRGFFDKWSVEGLLSVPVVCRVACGQLHRHESADRSSERMLTAV